MLARRERTSKSSICQILVKNLINLIRVAHPNGWEAKICSYFWQKHNYQRSNIDFKKQESMMAPNCIGERFFLT